MTPLLTLADIAYALYPRVPFRLLCGLARGHGRLRHRACPRERATVRHNLETAFGAGLDRTELDQLTRRAFEYRQLRALMLTLMPKLDPRRVERLLPLEGLEHLDAALAAGSGCIVATSHLNSICTFMAVERMRAAGRDIGVAMPVDADPYPPSRLRKALDGSSTARRSPSGSGPSTRCSICGRSCAG